MNLSPNNGYFIFSKSERKAWYLFFVINFCLIVAYILLDNYGNHFIPPPRLSFLSMVPDSMQHDTHDATETSKNLSSLKTATFNFDPNTISVAQWQQLGVKEKTALSIRKYIEKGGRFRKPEDLEKIWGLSDAQKKSLKPFVLIPTDFGRIIREKSANSKRQETVELNRADSAALERLPRIGPAMARRIISYRDRLGGYRSVEQLREVWGIPDSVFEAVQAYVRVDDRLVSFININEVEKEVLRIHPYFGYKIASAIVEYRNQHGNFKTLEEIQQIISIDEKTFRKILPYLILKK